MRPSGELRKLMGVLERVVAKTTTGTNAEPRIAGAAAYEAGANERARKRVAPGYPQGELPYPTPPQLAVQHLEG